MYIGNPYSRTLIRPKWALRESFGQWLKYIIYALKNKCKFLQLKLIYKAKEVKSQILPWSGEGEFCVKANIALFMS